MVWAFTKPSTVRPRFLPYHAYPTHYSIVQWWAKQHDYAKSRNKPTIIRELQLNMQKHINICCFSFNKVSMNKKTLQQENFDLMINFDFFDLITWDSLMVWAWNLVCGRFMNFQNGRKFWLWRKCGTHGTRGPKKHLNYSPTGDHILLVCGCEYCIYGQQCCLSVAYPAQKIGGGQMLLF